MINKKRLIRLTQELIRIDSQNPPGDESRIARFVADYLPPGLKKKTYEFKRGRCNVVAVLTGENKKRSLLITPHLDTVCAGLGWHSDPLAARIKGGRIYGLGATDCKGNLACALEVINSLIEDGVTLSYSLIFAATADEESGSALGLMPLLDKGILKPGAAVVLDSDDFGIIITQKGLMHLKVKIRGKRAHGAYPWQGINAIDISLDILKELKSEFYKSGYKKNKYLRPPTFNIGTIKGGDKVNIVADWCEFELDFRFLPGSKAEDLLKQLKKIIQKHTRRFRIEIEGIQKPFNIDKSHPLVRYFTGSLRSYNIKPVIQGSEGATTISFFQNKGIPSIATGFGSEGCAHIADEYVKISNLYKGALVLEDFLKNYRFD